MTSVGRQGASMRIALLSYRSKTHCGGQGVYVRHLSRGLVELGHDVEVFSGQPYPRSSIPGSGSPSLASTSTANPTRSGCRVPARSATASTCWALRDDVDLRLPRTAHVQPARRATARPAPRRVRRGPRQPVPGTGLLRIAASGLPVVATVHHPITRDRVLDPNPPRSGGESRWCTGGMALPRCRRRSRAASPTC